MLQSKLYVHGGVRNGQVTDELWVFDITTGNWTMLQESGYPVSGHTAHVVNRSMLVFFGYSPVFGYLNHVQQYDFGGFDVKAALWWFADLFLRFREWCFYFS